MCPIEKRPLPSKPSNPSAPTMRKFVFSVQLTESLGPKTLLIFRCDLAIISISISQSIDLLATFLKSLACSYRLEGFQQALHYLV